MTSYVLTASAFIRAEDDGRPVKYVRGDVITGLDADDVKRLLAAGAIAEKGAKTPDPEPEPVPVPQDAPSADDAGGDAPVDAGDVPVRPKSAATTEVWRSYAVAVGISEEDAAGMSKVQLQKATR